MNRMLMQGFCDGLNDLLSAEAWLSEARAELDAISVAIGTNEYLDPPDGGSVPLSIQVARMAKDAERYRKMRKNAVFQDRNGPGIYWYLERYDRALPIGERLDAALDRAP